MFNSVGRKQRRGVYNECRTPSMISDNTGKSGTAFQNCDISVLFIKLTKKFRYRVRLHM